MLHFRTLFVVAGFIACLALSIAGCGSGAEPSPAKQNDATTVRVFTVNYPLMYFAERLGGEHVEVEFPVPEGEDPKFWSPAPETISDYQNADLILLNGADYAQWVRRVTLPESRLIDTSRSSRDRYIMIEGGRKHSHGSGGEHSHQGIAATTWLDPDLAIAQADSIRRALTKLRPDGEDVFRDNFEALKSDLEALDNKLKAATQGLAGQPIVCSHPVFQYLARKYKLQSRTVHWEPGAAPTEDAWLELDQLLKSHPAKWMIWEAQPLAESVSRLSSMGVESTVVETCANRPKLGNWLDVMQRNADELARSN